MTPTATKPARKIKSPPPYRKPYWDADRGEWRYRGRIGHTIALDDVAEHALSQGKGERERGFAGKAMSRAGVVADQGAGSVASGADRVADYFGSHQTFDFGSVGGAIVTAFAGLMTLVLFELLLSPRGSVATSRLLAFANAGINALVAPENPLFGGSGKTASQTSPSSTSGSGSTTTQPVAYTTSTPASSTSTLGKVIGTPYAGTHAVAFNTAGGSNNWESENAYDFSAPVGTPIYAPVAGTIGSQFGSLGSGGRFAGLRLHLIGAANEFYLAHLSAFATGIKPGVKVQAGQLLGYSGEANGVAHLHFAQKIGSLTDPSTWAQLLGL